MARKSTNLDINLRFLTAKFERQLKNTRKSLDGFAANVRRIGVMFFAAFAGRNIFRVFARMGKGLMEIAEQTNQANGRWREFQATIESTKMNIFDALTPSANAMMHGIEQIAKYLNGIDFQPIGKQLGDMTAKTMEWVNAILIAAHESKASWEAIKINAARWNKPWLGPGDPEWEEQERRLEQMEKEISERIDRAHELAKRNADKWREQQWNEAQQNIPSKFHEFRMILKADTEKLMERMEDIQRNPAHRTTPTEFAERGSQRAFEISHRQDKVTAMDQKQLKELEKIKKELETLNQDAVFLGLTDF